MSTVESTEAGTSTTTARLDFGSAGIRMTPETFDATESYDNDHCYELVDGVVVVTPIPSEAEADPNEVLGVLLGIYKRQHPEGAALDRTLPERYIHLPNSRRKADRVIWVGLGRRPDPKTDVPAIAVEFVSAGKRNWKRDYETKRDEYLAAGVREYWIVDRFARTMTVHRQTEGGPVELTVQKDATYSTDLLPGFELPLQELLAAADEWENSND